MLGIFIGVASVIWLLAIGEGIGRAAQEQIAGLGARTSSSARSSRPADEVQDAGYGLTRDDYDRLLATVPTIDKAMPIREVPPRVPLRHAQVGRPAASAARPTTPRSRGWTSTAAASLPTPTSTSERNYCVLAAEVAERLFPFGDPLGQEVMVDEDFYEVVGVMKPRAPSAGIGGSLAAEDFSSDIYIPITHACGSRIGDMIVVDQAGPVPARHRTSSRRSRIQVKDRDLVLPTADVVRDTLDTLPHAGRLRRHRAARTAGAGRARRG